MIRSRMARLSGDNLTLLKAEAQRFGFYSLGLGDELCFSGVALTQQREKCEKLFLERDGDTFFLKEKKEVWFSGVFYWLFRVEASGVISLVFVADGNPRAKTSAPDDSWC